jgi:hypothetical protein
MAQPAPTAQQCPAVLTGVVIRHGFPIAESLTADLTAVVVGRESLLLTYLACRARSRAGQVLVYSVRSEAFRDGLQDAATWLSRCAAAAARRTDYAARRRRALRRAALVRADGRDRGQRLQGHVIARRSGDCMRTSKPDAARRATAVDGCGTTTGRVAPGW